MVAIKRFYSFIKWFLLAAAIILSALLILFFYQTDVTENTDTYIYDLPFKKGEQHRVVQGYGGLFSHSHTAALDFEMAVGTTVYAARGGVIYSYKDNSDEGGISSGYKNKANYLIVKHDDGSFGCYWHLEKNGVLVKKGRVNAGQPIARSGATGLVVQPHLHFSVKRKLSYAMDSFVKTKFRTSKGIALLAGWKVYSRP
jgi:murein DD-endopeptidase MepM/ murein hydrolase activator NlpD